MMEKAEMVRLYGVEVDGETVQFRPRGNSMKGKIESGQLVTVEPIGNRQLAKGDIVSGASTFT